MKSRITVEIDYHNNGRPFFKVVEQTNSDDMRDKAITQARHVLAHESMWCRVDLGAYQTDGSIQWNISPIPPQELEVEAEAIQRVVADRMNLPENQEG